MTQEIIYTSAPRGLRPGVKGFCTVASTQGMAPPLAEKLESLSGYRHIFPPHDPCAAQNPVNYSHLKLTVGGQDLHVLSRIGDAGFDYSQRSNKLAHHVAFSRAERTPGGPASVLAAPGFMETAWSGEPRILPAGRPLVSAASPPAICHAWQQLSGDAGWAGVLAESALQGGKPAHVIVPLGADSLQLVAEALALLPPDRRWEVTFSTFFTKLPPGIDCQWRFLIDGQPEAQMARRSPHWLVIDLGKQLPPAQGGQLVEAARTGKLPATERRPPVSSGRRRVLEPEPLDLPPPDLGISELPPPDLPQPVLATHRGPAVLPAPRPPAPPRFMVAAAPGARHSPDPGRRNLRIAVSAAVAAVVIVGTALMSFYLGASSQHVAEHAGTTAVRPAPREPLARPDNQNTRPGPSSLNPSPSPDKPQPSETARKAPEPTDENPRREPAGDKPPQTSPTPPTEKPSEGNSKPADNRPKPGSTDEPEQANKPDAKEAPHSETSPQKPQERGPAERAIAALRAKKLSDYGLGLAFSAAPGKQRQVLLTVPDGAMAEMTLSLQQPIGENTSEFDLKPDKDRPGEWELIYKGLTETRVGRFSQAGDQLVFARDTTDKKLWDKAVLCWVRFTSGNDSESLLLKAPQTIPEAPGELTLNGPNPVIAEADLKKLGAKLQEAKIEVTYDDPANGAFRSVSTFRGPTEIGTWEIKRDWKSQLALILEAGTGTPPSLNLMVKGKVFFHDVNDRSPSTFTRDALRDSRKRASDHMSEEEARRKRLKNTPPSRRSEEDDKEIVKASNEIRRCKEVIEWTKTAEDKLAEIEKLTVRYRIFRPNEVRTDEEEAQLRVAQR